MRRSGFYFKLLSLLVFLTSIPRLYPLLAEPDPIHLVSIQVLPTQEGATIEIQSDHPFSFITYTLQSPDRLVIDPVEGAVVSLMPGKISFPHGLVRGWELFRPAGEKEGVDYLSFELMRPAEHLVESTSGKLLIRVRPKVELPRFLNDSLGNPSSDPPADGPGNPSSNPPNDPPTTLGNTSRGESPAWDLAAVLEYGLSRHKPLQIAEEEMKLAQMKIREAHRALYPSATLKTSWTEGTAAGVDFRETSSGLQLEQPLYASGRLMETYRQALVNLRVAEKRKAKVKADFGLEIGQVYLQYITSQEILGLHEEFTKEAVDFLRRTKARFEKGLLTRLELLNVESQVNQAKFQRVSAENDVVLARLKFLQRLSLEPQAPFEGPRQLPQITPPVVNLEEALQLALAYRPDIQLNSLLVQFHEMEEEIAKAKGKLKIDLSGFIGASGSAFETETLGVGQDYFIGVKAAQAWGPHGATVSTTTTKTSPRLGQTTRTDSTVTSGELGILNQLQGLSEVQQAHIGLEKALVDLKEVKQTVYQEVQETYISYTKARLQLEYARQRIAFRQEQVKILQAQAGLNEALPSQVLEAVMRLTDERSAEVQALSNLHVALAKLNKAIGLPGHYR